MDFGRRIFGQDFFDSIPLHSDVGDVNGIAYILPYTPNPTARRAHRVYLKNMRRDSVVRPDFQRAGPNRAGQEAVRQIPEG